MKNIFNYLKKQDYVFIKANSFQKIWCLWCLMLALIAGIIFINKFHWQDEEIQAKMLAYIKNLAQKDELRYEKLLQSMSQADERDLLEGKYNSKFLTLKDQIEIAVHFIVKICSIFILTFILFNAIYWRNFLFLLAVNFVFFISIIPFTIWNNTNIYFFLLYFVLSLLALRIFKNFLAFFNTLAFYVIWLVLFNLHIG
ncbi:TPA: hypothetical protein SHC81_000516 [Campylobacter coli]|nr:hypothetical protein [Campylobacter coli]